MSMEFLRRANFYFRVGSNFQLPTISILRTADGLRKGESRELLRSVVLIGVHSWVRRIEYI